MDAVRVYSIAPTPGSWGFRVGSTGRGTWPTVRDALDMYPTAGVAFSSESGKGVGGKIVSEKRNRLKRGGRHEKHGVWSYELES